MKPNFQKKLTAPIVALTLLFIVVSENGNAQCKDFLKPHVDWIKNDPQDAYIHLLFVSNNGPQLAGYGSCDLHLNASQTALTGSLKPYKLNPNTNTFSQSETKSISININTGAITIGNEIIDSIQCNNLLMYGLVKLQGGSMLAAPNFYVFSLLDKKSRPIPQ